MTTRDPLSDTLSQLEDNLTKSNDISMNVVTTLDNFVTRFSKLTNEMESMNKHIQDFKIRHRNIDLTIRRLQDISENFNKPFDLDTRLKNTPQQVTSDLDGFLELVEEVKNSKKFFQQNHYYKSYDKAIRKLRELDQKIITRFHNELKKLLVQSCPSFNSGESFLKFLFLEDERFKESFLNSLKTKNLVYIEDYLEELGNVDGRFHKILHKVDDCKAVRSASSFEGGRDDGSSHLLPFVCLLNDEFPKEESMFFIKTNELKKMTRICGALSKMKNDEYVKMYITERPKSIRQIMNKVYYMEKGRKRARRRRAMSMSQRNSPGRLRLRSSKLAHIKRTEITPPTISSKPRTRKSKKKKKTKKKKIRKKGYEEDDELLSSDGDDSEEEEEEEEEEESGEEEEEERPTTPLTPIGMTNSPSGGSMTSLLFERHFYQKDSHPYLYLIRFYLRLLNEEKLICSTLVNQAEAKAHPTAIFGQVILSSLKSLCDLGMRIAKKGKENDDTGIISQQSEQFFVFLDLLESYDLHMREEFEKMLSDSSLGSLGHTLSGSGKGKGGTGLDKAKFGKGWKSSGGKDTYFSLIDSVFGTYRTRVVHRFREFQQKELIGQGKLRRSEAVLTTIHPSIPIAFTFFKRLLNYEEIVETLLRDHYPFPRKFTSIGRPEGRTGRAIGEYIRIVVEETISGTILGPIAAKSRNRNEMLSSLFELNNNHHILSKLEKGKVRSKVDISVLKSYQSIVRKAETRFVEVTWGRLCEVLEKVMRESPDTKQKRARKMIKSKYKEWQKGWVKITIKTKLPVLNKKLRERVVESTKDKVLNVFKNFLGEYETLLMTDRGLLKYNVKTVRDTIDNMYVDE